MTTRKIKNLPSLRIDALHAAVSQLIARTAHYDTDDSAAATLEAIPAASNEATLVTLANGLKAAWNTHAASTQANEATGSHAAADATNVVSAATATDTASAQTTVNELKGDYNAHVVDTTYHRNPVQRLVTVDDGSNEATSITLANELRRVVLDHLRDGGQTLSLVAS